MEKFMVAITAGGNKPYSAFTVHADTQEAAMRAIHKINPNAQILSCEWVR